MIIRAPDDNGPRAIDTAYKGYLFRSRLEARWAVYLDAVGIRWDYEPQGFDLEGTPYLPDFWLPDAGVWTKGMWAEVKPVEFDNEELRKAILLSKHTCCPVLKLIGIPEVQAYESLEWFACQEDFGSWLDWAILLPGIGYYSSNRHVLSKSGVHIGTVSDKSNHPDVDAAVTAARSARFEFGQTPRIQPPACTWPTRCPPPGPAAGLQSAVLVALIDLGTHTMYVRGVAIDLRRIYLVWECPGPSYIGLGMPLSGERGSVYRHLLERWDGRDYRDGEEINLLQKLGTACLLGVHRHKNLLPRVSSIGPLPPGVTAQQSRQRPFSWELGGKPYPSPDWVPDLDGLPVAQIIARCHELAGRRQ